MLVVIQYFIGVVNRYILRYLDWDLNLFIFIYYYKFIYWVLNV